MPSITYYLNILLFANRQQIEKLQILAAMQEHIRQSSNKIFGGSIMKIDLSILMTPRIGLRGLRHWNLSEQVHR